MKEPFYRYFIRSGWAERIDTPATIGAKCLKTLDTLTGIDPIFATWEIFDARNVSSLPLSAARTRMAAIVENNAARDDFGKPVPSYQGYRASALAGDFRDPRSVSFGVTAGGRYENGTKLEFGEYDAAPDLTIITYPLFKAALLAINAIWDAPWACAQAFRSGAVAVPMELGGALGSVIESVTQVPVDPTFPRTIFHIPWIGYLAVALAPGLRLSPEILSERTPDGGLLMTACEQRLDPGNPEHVRRARILAETMIACTGYRPGGAMRW
jgi:hypothetical protein